jgi:hypothetical protein
LDRSWGLIGAYVASGLAGALIGVNYRLFFDEFNLAYLAVDLILWVGFFVVAFLMLGSLLGSSSKSPGESKETPKAWTQLLVKAKQGDDGESEQE